MKRTTTAFSTATDTATGLTRLQREVLRLALEVERVRSRDDLDILDVRRGLVGKQLEVTVSAVPPRAAAGCCARRASSSPWTTSAPATPRSAA
jgi:hypothetical protein